MGRHQSKDFGGRWLLENGEIGRVSIAPHGELHRSPSLTSTPDPPSVPPYF